MPCVKVTNGTLCVGGPTYEFEGYYFENHRYLGPWPLNRLTDDPRTNIPQGFWDAIGRFSKLTDAEQREHEV